jgi:hypothetical protein
MPHRIGCARAMATKSKTTTTKDHEEIRRWVEEHDGTSATVGGDGDEVAVLRIDFPGGAGSDRLRQISWDEWFDKFDEEERETMLRLYCTILVEQESQKAIVIGRGGDMIKRIGTEARKDLEALFETRVFLDLRVKVNPDWRDDDRALDDMGVPRTGRRRSRR